MGYEFPEEYQDAVSPINNDNALLLLNGLDNGLSHLRGFHQKRIVVVLQKRSSHEAGTDVGERNVQFVHPGQLVECIEISVLKTLGGRIYQHTLFCG